MDGVQLPQGYRVITRRQITSDHLIPSNSWYSFEQPQKDERLTRPWSHSVVLNTGSLDWESSALNTKSLAQRNILAGDIWTIDNNKLNELGPERVCPQDLKKHSLT